VQYQKEVRNMKNYEKPIILKNEETAEGVYTASGSDCYTVTANIRQRPQEGRGDYRIQVNAQHAASHHSTQQILILNFNQAVTYSGSNGTLVSGNGTTTLRIQFGYHNNNSEGIGMGDVIVISDPGLALTGAVLQCNQSCAMH
jgi:hypothetical protein